MNGEPPLNMENLEMPPKRGEPRDIPRNDENIGESTQTMESRDVPKIVKLSISWWKFDSDLHSEFITDSVFQTKSKWHLKIWEYRNYPLKLISMREAVLPCHFTNIFCETWFWNNIFWELTPWIYPISQLWLSSLSINRVSFQVLEGGGGGITS